MVLTGGIAAGAQQPTKPNVDGLAERVNWVIPDGDMPIIQARLQQVFRAQSGAAAVKEGSQVQISIFSNEAMVDLSNSYFRGKLAVEISGTNLSSTGALAYEGLQPVLQNGIDSLVRGWRMTTYGGSEMERIDNYDYIAAQRDKRTAIADNARVTNKFKLKGFTLDFSQAKRISSTRQGSSGTDIYGIPFMWMPMLSGMFAQRTYLPLKYLNTVNFLIDLQQAKTAFQCLLKPQGSTPVTVAVTNSAYAGAAGSSTFALSPLYPTKAASDVSLSYSMQDIEFVGDFIIAAPDLEAAIENSVRGDAGLPIATTQVYSQKDPISTSSATQRIGKGLANIQRITSFFQLQADDNNLFADSYACEPFGLRNWQYRLGSENYPRDQVASLLHTVLLADQAYASMSMFKSPSPNVSWESQIGVIYQAQNYSGVVGVSNGANQLTTANPSDPSVTQCYCPSMSCLPSQFCIAMSMLASPDAQMSGVNTNHGHQMEFYFERLVAPATNTVIHPCSVVNLDRGRTADSVAFKIGPGKGGAVGNNPRVGAHTYAFGSSDPINVISVIESTRLCVIRPQYQIEIRE